MKPLPTGHRPTADTSSKTGLLSRWSPLFPANPLDAKHGSFYVREMPRREDYQLVSRTLSWQCLRWRKPPLRLYRVRIPLESCGSGCIGKC